MERNPFDVLSLPPHAGLDDARSSYRRLARQHHPDAVPAAARDGATRVMAELNWAIEELERDLEGWRRLTGGAAADAFFDALLDSTRWSEETHLTVEPRLVVLNRENGFTGWVTAAAPGVAARDLKLRYASELISVGRMDTAAGVTNFRIGLASGADGLQQEQSETVEIRPPDGEAVSVRVAVTPFTADEAAQMRQDRREPFKYPLVLLVAGVSFLAALASILLIA